MQFVKRNWGFYIVLLNRSHFKIKLLRFQKGQKLSYQYHNYRSELWLFLKGSGVFNRNENIKFLSAGDYILNNVTDNHTYLAHKTSWIIEVQFGERCVEEDIVRL